MYLLIPAAGMGKRMGSNQNKLLLKLKEKPLLSWTLKAANEAKNIKWIGIIGQSYDFPLFTDIIAHINPSKPVKLIQGGDTRQQSVYNGLQALPQTAEKVLIHDGARCLATPDLFNRCAETLLHSQALIAAIPVKDTIKVVNSNLIVKDTPPRENLWAAQTPQGFDVKLLKECHQKGLNLGWEVTDDAALLEKCGFPVQIVNGEETNLKVTTPIDLTIAQFILK
ncbi:MAG: 2-C-methyl-D-erythritol 4-phosphate cytidylyltransferase [Cyanobacteria bacterium]|nr:2-C-methyl-D-erythritol 4-phosphate cytidylyltransferase [Cyanobacteria bacterium CG_2015-22_32_23]NCQ41735.1 2-C-methyl-D-erythritol 4-phosphate cytidylyltransferase [Cyanobacteria bacterium CG_2015-04_32_10]NCS85959.1 2-C-methyl-D-erythritol 4-phosphate cytidylyltransferase [Cyanobacteria bacterium CG_2015-02_32_10]